ncbi:MAG TPA: hypothetical protein VNN73_13415 [Blastocatellia bacterium]|nr:hypothetical protein [Blastocatellia bacterium]
MDSRLLRYFAAVIALLCAATAATADVKVKTKTTVGGQSFEGTTYIKKTRQRSEQNFGPVSMATITQCDLRRSIMINEKAKTYIITPFGTPDSTSAQAPAAEGPKPKSEPTRRGGIITFTNNVVDTGERKQMFGLTARHLKITMTTESSPDACNPAKMKMEMDGWYVDFEYSFDCEMSRAQVASNLQRHKPDCVDEFRFKTTGTGKLGYPLIQTMIMYDDNGREVSRITIETVELSTATLDPALFDIPAGYTEAKNIQELYTGSIMSSLPSMSARKSSREEAATASTPSAMPSTANAATNIPGLTSASAPKKEGAIRIGLVMPKAQMSDGVNAMVAAEAVRNTFARDLNRPTVEVIALNARAPQQAIDEAKQSQCDYVLFSGLTQKKGGGGMFGKIAGNIGGAVASTIPYGSSTGGAAARAAAATAIYTTAEIAASVKAKDEITLDYRLETTDGAAKPVIETSGKAKAKSDGEDVITPMIEKAATAILAAVKK